MVHAPAVDPPMMLVVPVNELFSTLASKFIAAVDENDKFPAAAF